jgi:biopolymer transport protein ExbD
MALKKLDRQETPALPAINIVPLIDVVFTILTFFIMSTLFLTRSEGIPVNPPPAPTLSQPQNAKRITLSIAPDGQMFLNKQMVTIEQIEPGVKALLQSNPTMIVVINADEKASHGSVVAVMDRVKQVDGVRMAIASKK